VFEVPLPAACATGNISLEKKPRCVRAFAGGGACLKRAAARLLATFANHSALSYSNSIVSFNFFQQQFCPLQ